jgi:negative regulator of sigma E activity
MFDFLHNLMKSEEDRRQEMLTAYLDGALAPQERQKFERQLDGDAELRAQLQRQQLIKASLRGLPRVQAPRNFTLDPARYGKPAPQVIQQWYPLLRGATVVAAVFLVIVLSVDIFNTGGSAGTTAMAPAETPAIMAQELAGDQARDLAAAEALEVTAAAEVPAPAEEGAPQAAVPESAEESALAEPSESEPLASLGQATPEALASMAAAAEVTQEAEMAEAPAEGAAPLATGLPPTPATSGLSTASPPAATSQALAEGQQVQEEGAIPPAAAAERVQPPEPTPLRLAEFVLAFLFVLLATATLLLRRQL